MAAASPSIEPRLCERPDSWSAPLSLRGPEKVREVDAEAESLVVLQWSISLIHRKQHAAFDAVRFVEQQHRWSDERDTTSGVDHQLPVVQRGPRDVARRFDEEPKIGLRILLAPRGRTVAVHETDRRHGTQTIAVTLRIMEIARSRPEVVRARGVPARSEERRVGKE